MTQSSTRSGPEWRKSRLYDPTESQSFSACGSAVRFLFRASSFITKNCCIQNKTFLVTIAVQWAKSIGRDSCSSKINPRWSANVCGWCTRGTWWTWKSRRGTTSRSFERSQLRNGTLLSNSKTSNFQLALLAFVWWIKHQSRPCCSEVKAGTS